MASPAPNARWTHDPVTIADRLFPELQRAIVEGRLPPGAKISEPELARTHKVSRASLRETLGRLEACHLVERRPNLGARVVVPTVEKLLELYHVREALEGMACRLAAERMDVVEIAEMRALLAEHLRHADLQEGRAYYQKEGDLDFHYRLVQMSKNTRLISIFDDLYPLMRMYRYRFGMAGPRALPAFAEHGLILDAIADHDGELAELLMRRHIRASRRNVEQRLQEGALTAETADAASKPRRRSARPRAASRAAADTTATREDTP
jgi:DNA-binding GntR family transcriptional regulator